MDDVTSRDKQTLVIVAWKSTIHVMHMIIAKNRNVRNKKDVGRETNSVRVVIDKSDFIGRAKH